MFPVRYFARRYFVPRYFVSMIGIGFKLNITSFEQQTIGIITSVSTDALLFSATSTYATLTITRTDTVG